MLPAGKLNCALVAGRSVDNAPVACPIAAVPAIGERPALFEQGREYDLLVKQDGQWRIKKRVVIADSGLPERFKAKYEPRMDYDISAK